MTARRITLIGIAIAGAIIATETANAASYQHIDLLAVRIQANSGRLQHEFRLHYAHTPQYPHLIADARSLYVGSKHIYELVHRHGSLNHLARDLRSLDYSFQHLRTLVLHVEAGANHGHGHVHGHSGHVHQLMIQIAADINHLRADIYALGYHHIGHSIAHRNRWYDNTHPHCRPGITRRQGSRQSATQTRNYGEIRSGWTRTLSDVSSSNNRRSLSSR